MTFEELSKKVTTLGEEYEKAQHELRSFRKQCAHEWGPTETLPVNALTWLFNEVPFWVDPMKYECKFRRVCKLCGKIEETARYRERVTREPVWPSES